MTAPIAKKPSVDETYIGEYAAQQPVSGVVRILETTAVSGLGRGGFVRQEETGKNRKRP